MQLVVFVAWIDTSDGIVALGLSHCGHDFPGAVIGQFVHETVFHGWHDLVVHPVAISSDVVFFLDVGVDSTADSDHP